MLNVFGALSVVARWNCSAVFLDKQKWTKSDTEKEENQVGKMKNNWKTTDSLNDLLFSLNLPIDNTDWWHWELWEESKKIEKM